MFNCQIVWQEGFPGSSAGKESACQARDPGSISGSGRSSGEGISYPLQYSWASLVLSGKEYTCNAGELGSIPGLGKSPWRRAWLPTAAFLPGESPWTEEPGGLYSPWGYKESDTTEWLSTAQHEKNFHGKVHEGVSESWVGFRWTVGGQVALSQEEATPEGHETWWGSHKTLGWGLRDPETQSLACWALRQRILPYLSLSWPTCKFRVLAPLGTSLVWNSIISQVWKFESQSIKNCMVFGSFIGGGVAAFLQLLITWRKERQVSPPTLINVPRMPPCGHWQHTLGVVWKTKDMQHHYPDGGYGIS